MEWALDRLLALSRDWVSRDDIFSFLMDYHDIMVTEEMERLFPPPAPDGNGGTYNVSRVDNLVLAAHIPTQRLYILAWLRPQQGGARTSDQLRLDAANAREDIPTLQAYGVWYYFITQQATNTFYFGRLEWPMDEEEEEEDEDEEEDEYESSFELPEPTGYDRYGIPVFDPRYENAQDPWWWDISSDNDADEGEPAAAAPTTQYDSFSLG